VRKVEDYLQHAAECRQLAAATANDEHRQMLLEMAKTWESLAHDRAEQQLTRLKRMKLDDSAGEAS
jgi:hypothetical protein